MHASRQKILGILKSQGPMTVDELSAELDLSTVTVRHHLDVLRSEGLVRDPEVRHRATPGRPQYVYHLTDRAADYFPKAYDVLADNIIAWIKEHAGPDQVGSAFGAVAEKILATAPESDPEEPMEKRLDRAVRYLNQKGYVARWERTEGGYLLHTSNCPFIALAGHHHELCNMDTSMMTSLTRSGTEQTSRVVEGHDTCSYLIRDESVVTA